MSPTPSVAVVILNWNGVRYLQKFLPGVVASLGAAHRVVVADNASTDESVAFLGREYPAIQVIRLSQNWGFARGYNEALAEVDADYYILLNSDVSVGPGWIEPLIACLARDKSRGACQPKLKAYNQPTHFEYAGGAGGWIDGFGYPFSRGRVFDVLEDDHGQYDEAQPVFWASGACLCISASVWRTLGGLDPYFFAHQEEIDLCWRMQLAGYSLWCEPASVVYHVGGGTLPRGDSLKTYLNFRNNHIMLAKNLPFWEKAWKIPFRFGLDWATAIKGWVNGDPGYARAILRAHGGFLKWCLDRRTTHTTGRKPLRTLNGVFPGNIAWLHFARGIATWEAVVKKKLGKRNGFD